jgi:hypothetical protein
MNYSHEIEWLNREIERFTLLYDEYQQKLEELKEREKYIMLWELSK